MKLKEVLEVVPIDEAIMVVVYNDGDLKNLQEILRNLNIQWQNINIEKYSIFIQQTIF